MRRHLLIVLLSAMLATVAAEAADDRLAEALELIGLQKDDLGYRPRGYWSRFPNPARVPHKLHFFDALFSEPLRTYDFTMVMAQATRDLLSPERFAAGENTLMRLTYFLGVQHKVSLFRGYGANLDPQPAGEHPLLGAVAAIYARSGQDMRIMVYGKKADWPDPEGAVMRQLEGVPRELETIVAKLVLNLTDARRWRDLALRRVDPADLQAVFKMRSFHGHSTDGQTYPHQVDDVAAVLDEVSLYYAAQKAVQAAHEAAGELVTYCSSAPDGLAEIDINIETPHGRIVVAGTGADTHRYDDCAVLVDLGGKDTYNGCLAAPPSLDVPIAIAIDLDGDDVYQCDDEGVVTQGAGVFGAGVLIDLRGNDVYRAKRGSQGFGLFGLGLLADVDGDDEYALEYSGQGAAYFGIGLHVDGAGHDSYYLYGDGQGFGGPGGVGVMASVGGDDRYTAEPLAEIAGRPDYHSQMKIAVNQAQGSGAGARADGSHGHSWAGGLGALIDISGHDRYESGNWSLGTGYWFGTGLVYDGEGDDVYRSVYFTQASGAHFCIGAIIDEGGNDRHVLTETSGAGIAFGWDFTVALLLDKGGNDHYEMTGNGVGCAQIRSNAMLIDIGGNDTYVATAAAQTLGCATYMESYARPSYHYGPYSLYGNSVGLLLDIGGADRYVEPGAEDEEEKRIARAADGTTWLKPPKDDANYGFRSFGIGVDVETGTVPDFFIYAPPSGE